MIARNRHLRGLLAYIALCAALSTYGGVAAAQSTGAELIEAARCYACHQMADYSLAPPYVAIAARHAPRKDVMVDVLASKIVHGGGGNWGVVPMVPNQWVSLDEARVMAAWILSLADQ